MRPFSPRIIRFLRSEDAPTAMEYAVMLALVIVVVVGAVTLFGQKVSGSITNTVSSTGLQ